MSNSRLPKVFGILVEAMMLLGITPAEFIAFALWTYGEPEMRAEWDKAGLRVAVTDNVTIQ